MLYHRFACDVYVLVQAWALRHLDVDWTLIDRYAVPTEIVRKRVEQAALPRVRSLHKMIKDVNGSLLFSSLLSLSLFSLFSLSLSLSLSPRCTLTWCLAHSRTYQRARTRAEPFDLVLAFHVCGGATDEAVDKALELGCCFVMCPCCIGKLKFSQSTIARSAVHRHSV